MSQFFTGGGGGGLDSDGGGSYPPYMTGDAYYTGDHTARSLSIIDTQVFSQGHITFMPFYCSKAITWDRISAYVRTVTAGDEIELLIYSNGDDGQPDELLVESGALTLSIDELKEATINYEMSKGWYWLGCLFDNGNTGTVNLLAFNSSSTSSANGSACLPRSLSTITADNSSLEVSGTYTVGNAPVNPAVTIGINKMPMLFLRKT